MIFGKLDTKSKIIFLIIKQKLGECLNLHFKKLWTLIIGWNSKQALKTIYQLEIMRGK